MFEPSMFIVNNCSFPEITEMNTSRLPSGEGDGSKFCACVICTGIDNARSAPSAGITKQRNANSKLARVMKISVDIFLGDRHATAEAERARGDLQAGRGLFA